MIAQQGAEVVEEGDPPAQVFPQVAIELVGEVGNGMQEKREEHQRKQCQGEILIAMAKVVLQPVAVIFQYVVVFVFDFPMRPATAHQFRQIVLRDREVRDPGVMIAGLSGVAAGDVEFEPIDLQGIRPRAQRNVIAKAIGPHFAMLAVPFADRVGGNLGFRLGECFIERQVGIWLTAEQKVTILVADLFAQGLMRIQIIAHHNGVPWRIAGQMLAEPAFAGGLLAVLLGVAILGHNELWRPGDHMGVVGGHHGGEDGAVEVFYFPIAAFSMGAVSAFQRVRIEILNPVQAKQDMATVQHLIGLYIPFRNHLAPQCVKFWIKMIWRYRIQYIPDVLIAGDILYLEQGLCVTATGTLLHTLLPR